jgi:hypothetical protein
MRVKRLVEIPVLLLTWVAGQAVALRMWMPAIILTLLVLVLVQLLDRRRLEP